MSSSNCCFLTCIYISQESGKVAWHSRLFKNFPQFVVIHTVTGFGIINKAKVDAFLELCYFSDGPMDVCNLISDSSAFSKSSLSVWNFLVHILLNMDPLSSDTHNACLCKERHLPSNALPLVVVCKFSLDSKRLMNKREYNSPEGNSLRKWNKFWGRMVKRLMWAVRLSWAVMHGPLAVT